MDTTVRVPAREATAPVLSGEADFTGSVSGAASGFIRDAIRSICPNARRVVVDLQAVRVTDSRGRRLVYLTPRRMVSAMLAIDLGDPVRAFACKLGRPFAVTDGGSPP